MSCKKVSTLEEKADLLSAFGIWELDELELERGES